MESHQWHNTDEAYNDKAWYIIIHALGDGLLQKCYRHDVFLIKILKTLKDRYASYRESRLVSLLTELFLKHYENIYPMYKYIN